MVVSSPARSTTATSPLLLALLWMLWGKGKRRGRKGKTKGFAIVNGDGYRVVIIQKLCESGHKLLFNGCSVHFDGAAVWCRILHLHLQQADCVNDLFTSILHGTWMDGSAIMDILFFSKISPNCITINFFGLPLKRWWFRVKWVKPLFYHGITQRRIE